MSLTVTIHEGELRQIKQHVAEKRIESGHLFGLWTHSNQPVVQYITGSLKDEDEEELFKPHALRRVGIWSTKESGGVNLGEGKPCFVYMKVDVDNETLHVKQICVVEKEASLKGILEVLPEDSAFRLSNPFSGTQRKYHNDPVKGEFHWTSTSSQQAETKREQWYSVKEGMDLFGKIHGALKEKFQVTGTSRDKETHDLCVALRFVQRDFAIEFPANFPDGEATLSIGNKDTPISLGKPVKEKGNFNDSKSGEKQNDKADHTDDVAPDDNRSKEAASEQSQRPGKHPDDNEIAQLLVQGILKIIQPKNREKGSSV